MEKELAQTPEGIWVVKKDTHITKWVTETRRLDHDQYLLHQILPFVTRNSVVIDVGANIGDHTIAYCEATGPQGIVVAYEPSVLACECLRRNVPECLAFNCAVGNKIGIANFAPNEDNTGASHMSDEGTMTVNITTLNDDFAQILSPLGWKNVSFLKIDVEGTEPEVLEGGERLIVQYRPAILLEVNNGALKRRGHSHRYIKDFMTRNKYRVLFIPPQHDWDSEQSDILCLPS